VVAKPVPPPAAPQRVIATPTPTSIPAASTPLPATFKDMVALFAEKREGILHAHLVHDVHLVSYEPGRFEINLGAGAPPTLANKLTECLNKWTGARWMIGVSTRPGLPTLAEEAARTKETERAEAAEHPVVKAALETFPGATIVEVRRRENAPAPLIDSGEEPPEMPEPDGEGA
jgi:DNA polymerase-3 subunit gamma/tau